MAINLVQTTSASASANSSTITFSATSTAGNTLVCAITHVATGSLTLTDTSSNIWVQAGTTINANPSAAATAEQVDIWYCLNAQPITTVTVTNASSNSGILLSFLSEYSGIGNVGVVSVGYSATTTMTPPTQVITYTANNLLFGVVAFTGSSQTVTAASPNILQATVNSSTNYMGISQQLTTAASTVGPAFSFQTSSAWGQVVIQFTAATAPSTIGLVQSKTGTASAINTTITFPTATKAGNTIVLILQHAATGLINISDTGSNTWSLAGSTVNASPAASGVYQVGVWYCVNAKSATSITFTNANSTSGVLVGYIAEYEGINTFGAATVAYSATTTKTPPAESLTYNQTDLVISAIAYNGASVTATAASPFSLIATPTLSPDDLAIATMNNASVSGTKGATFSLSTASAWGQVVVNFSAIPSTTPPRAPAVQVRASSNAAAPGATTWTLPFPGVPQVNDPIGIWISHNNNNDTVTAVPSEWTIAYSTTVGTGCRTFIYTNSYQTSMGSSVGITLNNAWGTGSAKAAIVVLNGSVHSGFGTIGIITNRPSSSTLATAVATGSSANPNLVIFHEKTTSQTISMVSGASEIQNVLPISGEAGSVYVGAYDTSMGTQTFTAQYGLAGNTNACGYQIPILPVATSGPWVNQSSGIANANSATQIINFGFTSTTGNLLVVVQANVYAPIDPTGWTAVDSLGISQDVRLYYKTSAGESSLTLTYTNSGTSVTNNPVTWTAYEFAAPASFTSAITGTSTSSSFPVLTGLPGTPQLIIAAMSIAQEAVTSSVNGTWSSPWSIDSNQSIAMQNSEYGIALTTGHQNGVTTTTVAPSVAISSIGVQPNNQTTIIFAISLAGPLNVIKIDRSTPAMYYVGSSVVSAIYIGSTKVG